MTAVAPVTDHGFEPRRDLDDYCAKCGVHQRVHADPRDATIADLRNEVAQLKEKLGSSEMCRDGGNTWINQLNKEIEDLRAELEKADNIAIRSADDQRRLLAKLAEAERREALQARLCAKAEIERDDARAELDTEIAEHDISRSECIAAEAKLAKVEEALANALPLILRGDVVPPDIATAIAAIRDGGGS